MDRYWLTIASPTTEAMVNPLLAACDEGYTPETIRILSNPAVGDQLDQVESFFDTAVSKLGSNPTIDIHTITAETSFDEITAFYRDGIEKQGSDTEVAVDITPGRKFMSAIAFQAGIQYGASHVFYLHVDSSAYYQQVYPDIPRPALDLIDFTEVVV